MLAMREASSSTACDGCTGQPTSSLHLAALPSAPKADSKGLGFSRRGHSCAGCNHGAHRVIGQAEAPQGLSDLLSLFKVSGLAPDGVAALTVPQTSGAGD